MIYYDFFYVHFYKDISNVHFYMKTVYNLAAFVDVSLSCRSVLLLRAVTLLANIACKYSLQRACIGLICLAYQVILPSNYSHVFSAAGVFLEATQLTWRLL